VYLLRIGMGGAQHCGCVGTPCLYDQLTKKPGQSVWDHIRCMRGVLARYMEDMPNSCPGIENNRVVFLLLTLMGDPEWHYRVDKLYPQAHDPCPWGRCCWCEWEPMGISIVDLINYLRLKGPHSLEHIPTASEEDTPPREMNS